MESGKDEKSDVTSELLRSNGSSSVRRCRPQSVFVLVNNIGPMAVSQRFGKIHITGVVSNWIRVPLNWTSLAKTTITDGLKRTIAIIMTGGP